MPTYEYQCSRCRKSYDVQQRMTDPILNRCWKCGSTKIKRCISLPSIITSAKTEATQVAVHRAVQRAFPGYGPRAIDATAPPDFRAGVVAVKK